MVEIFDYDNITGKMETVRTFLENSNIIGKNIVLLLNEMKIVLNSVRDAIGIASETDTVFIDIYNNTNISYTNVNAASQGLNDKLEKIEILIDISNINCINNINNEICLHNANNFLININESIKNIYILETTAASQVILLNNLIEYINSDPMILNLDIVILAYCECIDSWTDIHTHIHVAVTPYTVGCYDESQEPTPFAVRNCDFSTTQLKKVTNPNAKLLYPDAYLLFRKLEVVSSDIRSVMRYTLTENQLQDDDRQGDSNVRGGRGGCVWLKENEDVWRDWVRGIICPIGKVSVFIYIFIIYYILYYLLIFYYLFIFIIY
eukprot:GHVR01143756.1.p1 GENE.GHVR01143756.1~~GHVR01143756.1.p1  ORF type:complete len:322 (+),score=94.71 GHVR01143756.1:303-1268(+)